MTLTLDLDTSPLEQVITQMPEVLKQHCLAACKATADNIVREAKGRLQRQLGPTATGATVAGIEASLAFDGNGYVVLADRDPFPNLPLWLEKGTRAGKRKNHARTPAKPFFYASIELEAGQHERRIVDAMRDAAEQVGLG